MSDIKDKVVKTIAIATVTIISGALIAYLKDPANRAILKAKAKKAQKQTKKEIKLLQKKVATLRK